MPPDIHMLGDPLELPKMVLYNDLIIASMYAAAVGVAAFMISIALIIRKR